MKIAVLMLSSNGEYKKMVDACKETWINDAPEGTKVFYSYGRGHKDELLKGLGKDEYVVTEDNEIIVNTREARENILKKTIKGFEYLLNQDFDYIVRINCGSYINLNLLNRFLLDKPRTGYYSGVNDTWGTQIQIAFTGGIKYASGACIKMSTDVVGLLVEKQDELEYDGNKLMDDVSIGDFLLKNHIKLQNDSQRVDSFTNQLRRRFDKKCYHHYFRHSVDQNAIYICHHLSGGIVDRPELLMTEQRVATVLRAPNEAIPLIFKQRGNDKPEFS
jgi:hypothetical protein